MNKWKPIKQEFDNGVILDIFSKSEGRLCNYRFSKNAYRTKGNNFFEPVVCGPSCVRDATHWMPIPENPKSPPETIK